MSEDVFCKIVKGEIPSYTCYEDELVKCIMDANPESPGHILIIPKKHYTDIMELDETIDNHINLIAKKIIQKMMDKLRDINGVVTVINYGPRQVVKHYHMHLIPTYNKRLELNQEEICEILKRD